MSLSQDEIDLLRTLEEVERYRTRTPEDQTEFERQFGKQPSHPFKRKGEQ